MAGVSGLVELLCKSHFDSDPADSPSIALTQLGTDSIEASPCGFRAPLTRRTILSQTTVEDALNRLRHFSNTLLGADSRLSARFFHLLCKLYYDSTVSRIPLLKLCCDKALAHLGWKATLTFEETIRFTAEWYHRFYRGDGAKQGSMLDFSLGQIAAYVNAAEQRGRTARAALDEIRPPARSSGRVRRPERTSPWNVPNIRARTWASTASASSP